MEDKNENSIPDAWDKRIGLFLTFFVGVLWIFVESGAPAEAAKWLMRAIAIISLAANTFSWGLKPRPGKAQ